MKKNTYYIEYWDRHEKIKSTFIKARTPYEADKKFYKTHPFDLIRKTSLL